MVRPRWCHDAPHGHRAGLGPTARRAGGLDGEPEGHALLVDGEAAVRTLERLARQRPSSDVRVALAAMLWRSAPERSEELFLDACAMPGALCDRYRDKDFLVTVRRWTPKLVDAVQDFLDVR